MDVTERVLCGGDIFNPVLSMGLQASLILSFAHLLQIVVRPTGIPTPIPQLTAGLLIGHSVLSKIKIIQTYFYQSTSGDYYNVLAFFGRTCVVFLIGLELDISYMKRHLRSAGIIALASALPCIIFSGGVSYFFFKFFMAKHQEFVAFMFVFILAVSNSASPLVVRFIAELRLGTSHFGRLAVCSSLVNDLTGILWGALLMKIVQGGGFEWVEWIWSLLFTAIVSFVVRRLALVLNQFNSESQYLKNTQIFPLFLLVLLSASFVDKWGAANSILAALVIGVTFPREGKTARTMTHKLSFTVYTFVLPVYFGYTGFQTDFGEAADPSNLFGVLAVVLLSIGGKVLGTLAACRRLGVSMKEGIVLGLLMNLKGHFDVLILGTIRQKVDWNKSFVEIMLMTIVLNTLLSGIMVSYIVLNDNDTFGYKFVPLEKQNPEIELRVLACVYTPRHVSAVVKVVGWLNWSRDFPLCAYLIHLVELIPPKKVSRMYNQLGDDELSDDETYGGNDAVEINKTVDSFISETNLFVRQTKIVSTVSKIYEEVCDAAEEFRASIVILPFHKHQRIDGKMESGKDSIRTTNQRLLRHAPCTVGILIDRGVLGVPQTPSASGSVTHVAALFFGGADDREALSLSIYISMNLKMSLTVVRFMQVSVRENEEKIDVSSRANGHVLMAMPSGRVDDEKDNAFLEDFYNKYVTSGRIGYIEKPVKNGAETTASLKDIVDAYQLFIVGNGGRRNSCITTGMSDWEECPELGTVGDLLASSEFDPSCSVLVIHQYKPPVE